MITLERASQEQQIGANFSFIAPSSEELRIPILDMHTHGKGRRTSGFTKRWNADNSSLEGAMKLKLAPFCSSWDALSDGILFSKLFLDSENQNHGL